MLKVIQQLDKLGRNIENKVSNNVSYDDVNKSEILLNENNNDILSNNSSDNELSLIHIFLKLFWLNCNNRFI